jgi:uncharacterized Fe-S cluster-containing radical SAM superfamily enzyme
METRIGFQDLKFREPATKAKEKEEKKDALNAREVVVGEFLDHYYFTLSRAVLEEIAPFRLQDEDIVFECTEKRARQKLDNLIEKGLRNLVNRIRNKKTVYISEASGIPLIGANEFGLVDRGTNIIEVKPSTGCNLSCIFCSVNEGENDHRDILVEEEYIVQEFRKLAAIKKHPIEASINPHGEPLLYPRLMQLVKDLKETPNVDIVSINTNGCMLNKKLIDELAEAGLTRINISIHSLDKTRASALASTPYNVDNVLEMIKYCEGKIDVLLAPVLVPGKNEQDMDDIIELSKTIKNKRFPTIGIQNFLSYKGGRNAAKEMPWDSFFELLKKKEIEHNVKLIIEENLFNIEYDETLPKPFKKGQIIKVELKLPGRAKGEMIAVADERCIIVYSCRKESGHIKVKLLRDKHNIYTAVPC